MSETIIVALLSLLGSLGGTLGGIALNSKLSNANAFSDIPAQARFIVANAEMLVAFSNATNWNTFAARYEVES